MPHLSYLSYHKFKQKQWILLDIDGLVQQRRNSIANALKLRAHIGFDVRT